MALVGVDVAVLNQATVKDLKNAVQKKVNELEQTNMGHRHISWYLATCYQQSACLWHSNSITAPSLFVQEACVGQLLPDAQ